MEYNKKLGKSPDIERGARDKINAITKIYKFGRFSETVRFFVEVFDLLFTGREFETTEEMKSFVSGLLNDKSETVIKNIILKRKLGRIQKIIDE